MENITGKNYDAVFGDKKIITKSNLFVKSSKIVMILQTND